MIDLSVCYKNEENIGKALKRIYDEKIVNRSDIFIILKMMPFKEVIL
jgi:diketogulonate reductase-like aldo/keto reductase